MDPHPLALAYPAMTADEYAAFKADIAANGLRNPIWLFEGRVLDGRNRYRACDEIGLSPRFETFTGTADEAAAFVESQNLHRRHLTAEFRRERVKELRATGMSLRQIAKAVGASVATVHDDLSVKPEPVQFRTPAPAPNPLTLGERPPGDGPPEEIDPEDAAHPAIPIPPPPAPQKVTGRDGKQYPAERPKPAPQTKPNVEPQREDPRPRPQWADVADQLARVATAIEAMGRTPEEESEPWNLVESLERTASVLLRRARELRRRHRLN